MRNVSHKFVEKIKTFLFKNFFFLRKLCRLLVNVEKCGRLEQATDDNIIRRMHNACRIPKATNTHSDYVTRTASATMVSRTRINFTLYVHRLSCLSRWQTEVSEGDQRGYRLPIYTKTARLLRNPNVHYLVQKKPITCSPEAD
jgi:hypothetical protein